MKNAGTPPMGKEKTDKTSGDFLKGGSTHMFGPQHAGPQKPGVSSSEGQGTAGKDAQGGSSNHMFGPQHADPQKPGVAGHDTGGSDKFAKGGTGADNKMFGYTGSKPATPA